MAGAGERVPLGFQDHFSARAEAYARFRPTYPAALFAWLASLTDRHDLAWDCGTGNGQAALGLAGHYASVHATDPSERQLAQAQPHARVAYRRAAERDSGLPAACADLVAAAQAFHWFDATAFFAEAARVLRPGGVLAIWCYGLSTITPELDPVVRHFHQGVVGADWPQGREMVDELYRQVRPPFPEIAPPSLAIERELDLAAFGDYVATWSAVQRHRARTGRDPLPALLAKLAGPWGDPRTPRRVTWPIGMRACRAPR